MQFVDTLNENKLNNTLKNVEMETKKNKENPKIQVQTLREEVKYLKKMLNLKRGSSSTNDILLKMRILEKENDFMKKNFVNKKKLKQVQNELRMLRASSVDIKGEGSGSERTELETKNIEENPVIKEEKIGNYTNEAPQRKKFKRRNSNSQSYSSLRPIKLKVDTENSHALLKERLTKNLMGKNNIKNIFKIFKFSLFLLIFLTKPSKYSRFLTKTPRKLLISLKKP